MDRLGQGNLRGLFWGPRRVSQMWAGTLPTVSPGCSLAVAPFRAFAPVVLAEIRPSIRLFGDAGLFDDGHGHDHAGADGGVAAETELGEGAVEGGAVRHIPFRRDVGFGDGALGVGARVDDVVGEDLVDVPRAEDLRVDLGEQQPSVGRSARSRRCMRPR